MTTDSAERLFQEALQAGRERDYPQAIRILKELLCRTDRLPEALLYLGRSYHALGDFDRSVQALLFFLKEIPDSAAGHFFLGRSYLCLGLYRQALKHLKASTELEEDFSPAFGLLGLSLLKLGRARAAILYFEKALKLNPHQPKIFNGYLNALLTQAIRSFRRGEWAEATEIFQFILKHRSNSLVVHLHLASIYRELGDHQLALRHFKQASGLAPSDPVLYLQQAVTYLQSGNSALAAEVMEKAMGLLGRKTTEITDPENLLRLVTLVLFQNHRYREAIRSGKKILKYFFHDVDIHTILAECFSNLGDLERAKNHYLRALDGDRNRLTLNYGVVAVLWQKGEFKEVLRFLGRIEKLNPDDELVPYYLALTLPHLNEPPERTIVLLQEQIRRTGPDPHLMCALAGEYLKGDLPELAEGWYLRTLRLVEGHGESLESLIVVYRKLNKSQKLIEAYGDYLKHFPENQILRRELIQLLFEERHYQRAAAEILKLLPHEPGNRTLKRLLALSYHRMKRYGEAIILLRELLKGEPGSKEFLKALVFCLAESDQQQEAIALLEKASKIFPAKTDLLLPLGVLYFKARAYEKAAETFRGIISFAANNWKAHHNLGVVYEKTGNHQFARKFFQHAEELKQSVAR